MIGFGISDGPDKRGYSWAGHVIIYVRALAHALAEGEAFEAELASLSEV